ncbi:aspartate aminotransferase family protein [Patescibacteria group bacterium]|nr:aspartate aminotransferase family protein [Patescibacteria group bacterium]
MINNKIIYNNFSNYQFRVKKAKDSYIWDEDGNKLVDFTAGWNVVNLGWNNDEVNEAIQKQAKKNIYTSMRLADPIQEEYADILTKALPKNLQVVTREATGVTANIMAIKMARANTGKKKILSFRDTFHDSLYQALQLGYAPEYPASKAIFLNFENHIHLSYPRVRFKEVDADVILNKFINDLKAVLKKDRDIAAFVTEAGIITGWGSTYVAPTGFLNAIRKLTKKYGVLLILDEMGTGFSRTGELFAMHIEGVTPDIVTFAKGIANGANIAATVTSKEIAEGTYGKSDPQSTFGWSPLNVAAALKTLEIHKRDKVWKKAKKDGKYVIKTLWSELGCLDYIDDINGMGLEIGVALKQGLKGFKMPKFIEKARRKGLHLANADSYSFQIMPPLTISRKDLNKGLEIFVKNVKEIFKS